jgi:hypothetical protein
MQVPMRITLEADDKQHMLLWQTTKTHFTFQAANTAVTIWMKGRRWRGRSTVRLGCRDEVDQDPFTRTAPPDAVGMQLGVHIQGVMNNVEARKSSWHFDVTGRMTLVAAAGPGEPPLVIPYDLINQRVRVLIPKSAKMPPRDKVGFVYNTNQSMSGNLHFVPDVGAHVNFRALFAFLCRRPGGTIGRRTEWFTGFVLYSLVKRPTGLLKTVFLVFRKGAILAVGRNAMEEFNSLSTSLVRDTLLPFREHTPVTSIMTMRAGVFRLPAVVNGAAARAGDPAAAAGYNQDVIGAIRVEREGYAFIFYDRSAEVIVTAKATTKRPRGKVVADFVRHMKAIGALEPVVVETTASDSDDAPPTQKKATVAFNAREQLRGNARGMVAVKRVEKRRNTGPIRVKKEKKQRKRKAIK